MLGNEYDFHEASDEAACDYRIAPTNLDDNNHDEQYDCYTVVDRHMAVAVPDTAPSAAHDAVKADGWEPIPMSELEQEEVKEFVGYFETRPAFYEETPPENRYESIPRENAEEFLDYHDRQYKEVSEAVWYPERGGCAISYTVVDGAGRVNRHAWERDNVTVTERQILLDGADVGDEEDDGLSREEVAELVEENSPIYPREAEITSCWVEGVDDYQQIVRELGANEVTYDSVAQSIYNFRDRQQAVAWAVLHVWPEVPNDHLAEEAREIVKTLDEAGLLADVRDPAFTAEGKGRGK